LGNANPRFDLSISSKIVIPTGAHRSGGTCCSFCNHKQLQPESPLSPCHPDRSEA
jgi:hypothetical protein